MPQFNSQQLQGWTGGQWLNGREPAGAVCGFTQDSRALRQGMCFVALKTEQRDGHAFIEAAAAAGAAMALVAVATVDCALPQLVVADPLRAFQQIARAHRQEFTGRVIGVTGSCGKTSTKDILHTLLGERCHATVGNLNNFIGVPLTLLQLDGQKHDCAVIEAGISEPGEMATLTDMIRPDIAIVTMVGPAHLQDLGSVEGVAAEKALLAAAVASTPAQGGAQGTATTREGLPLLFAPLECWQYPAFASLRNHGIAVAPLEDNQENAQRAAVPDAAAEPAPFKAEGSTGTAAAAITLPSSVSLCRYRLEASGGETVLAIQGEPLAGRFALGFTPSSGMASNLVLALLAAHALGVPQETLVQRVRDWQPRGNRGRWQRIGAQHFFVDCYNANPSSMADSLSHFTAALAVGDVGSAGLPRLFVFGGMRELGADSALWHERVGVMIGRLLNPGRGDAVVLIGEVADNAACAEGIRRYAPTARIDSFAATAEARPVVAAFAGVIFLKGSRYYALETLLPECPPG